MKRLEAIGFALASSFFVVALPVLARPLSAQMSGFVATPMLQTTAEGADGKDAAMLSITIAPGGTSGRHTHPGDCYGTVVEGTVELHVDGREPRLATAGQAWYNARGVVHELRNVGDAPLRVVNTLIVDKGKPRMQPAPR